MSSVIQNLLDTVVGEGARSTKFDCIINFGNTGLFDKEDDIMMMVKTSQFPGKTHDTINLKYKGRTIPIKGQTKYDNTWSCSFYLTQDHKLKHSFENWIESLDQQHNIKNVTSGVQQAQSSNSNSYTTSIKIAQADFHGYEQTIIYELYNVFPKSVSMVEVDYSSVGSILEFTVEFSYSHFDSYIEKASVGTYVDELKSKANNGLSEVVGAVKSELSSIFSATSIGTVVDTIANTVKGGSTFLFSASDMASDWNW